MRTVYLPLDECYGLIGVLLKPYVGVVGEIADHHLLLENILEEYFYERPLHNVDSKELLTQYRLPSDVARDILNNMTIDVIRAIQNSFQVIYPARHYSYRMLGDCVMIQETAPRHDSPVEPVDTRDHESDDGYTPERLRSR